MLAAALSAAFADVDRPGLCLEAVVVGSLRHGPVPSKELWRHARVSKRAMTTLRKAAVRRGLVADDGEVVTLVVDPPAVTPAACAPLAELVSRFELDHPDFPVTYGTADQSFTGGPGVDWKPVPREGGVADLPLSALLSQALVAFGIAYERAGAGPIMWAELLRRGTFAFGMERHRVMPNTSRGRLMLGAYEPTCAAIESSWRDRFGSSLIDDVIGALGGGSAPFPVVGWTAGECVVVASGS